MQIPDQEDIFLTQRYVNFLECARKIGQGKSSKTLRTLLRDRLNDSLRSKVFLQENSDLLIGAQKVNSILQRILSAHLSNMIVDFKQMVPEESTQYLMRRIFFESDVCESHKMESLVMDSFKKLDVNFLERRKDQRSGKFQDIVNLMRFVIDDLCAKLDY